MATRDDVIEAIKTVEDPELFLDIWFLGLIYRIVVDGSRVEIDMTFTSPMCPAGPQLIDEVKTKVSALEGVEEVELQVVFEPQWEPSDDVKAMMGMI
jgi:metal-sulfur cluster biosynthetic enzyme